VSVRPRAPLGPALAALLLAAASAARAAPGDWEEWLPSNTPFVVVLDDVERTRARFLSGVLQPMWDDPALAAVRVSLDEALGGTSAFFDLLRGRVLVAVDGKRFVALLDVGDRGPAFDALMARRAAGGPLRAIGIRGHTVQVTGPTGRTRVYCREGSLVVAGNALSAVQEVLLRRAGGGAKDSLAASASYRAARARTTGADAFLYGRLRPTLQALANGELDPVAMAASGLDTVESLAGGLRLRDDGVLLRLFLHAPGEKRGLLKMFAGRNADLAPPRLLPPDTAWGMVLNLDLTAVAEEALRMADAVDPGTSALVRAKIAEVNEHLGLEVGRDIVAPLSGRVAVYGIGAEAWGAGDGDGLVARLGLEDPPRFEKSLELLVARFGAPVRTSDFLGMEIRTLPGVAWSLATGDAVVFAPKEYGVQRLLLRHGRDLEGPAGTEAFRTLRAALPRTCSFLLWANPRAGRSGPDEVGESEIARQLRADNEVVRVLGVVNRLASHLRSVGIALRDEEDGVSLWYYAGFAKPTR